MANPFTSAKAPTSAGLGSLDLLMPDASMQQRQLLRQQALADALRQQALSGDDGATQVVSGWAIPNGISRPISQIAEALGANLAQRRADEKQQALAAALSKGIQERLSAAGGGGGGIDINTAIALTAAGVPLPPKVMERAFGVGPDKQRVSTDTGNEVKSGFFDPTTGTTTYDSTLAKAQTPDSVAAIASRENLDKLNRPIEQQRADAATANARSAAIMAGAAGGFAGTGIDAQAMNVYGALTLQQQRGEPLTPQQQMQLALATRQLMQPRVVGSADGGMSVVTPPPLPGATEPPSAAPGQGQGAPSMPGAPTVAPLTQKQPSEGERKDAGFAARMRQSGAILDNIGPSGQPSFGTAAVRQLPVVGGVTERLAQTENQQTFRQAQEDWVRAKLRKESGAVIGPQEMEDEIRTYFPQPGDGKDVIAQKSRQRELATQSMEYAAGKPAIGPLYQQLQIAPSATGAPGGERKVVKFGDLK